MSSRREAVRDALVIIVAVAALVVPGRALAQPAPSARPAGGVIVGGHASITQNSTSTAVLQSSERAAIDWRSFDVGSQHSVTIQAPNAKALTLMVVTGADPSAIAGRIVSSGQMLLVDQNGVALFKGAQLNLSGLVLSAPGVSVRRFMNGGAIALDRPPNPDAKIVNDGTIAIRNAGLAGLIAPDVVNAGTITARLGSIALVGAASAALKLFGDEMIALQPTGAVMQAPSGAATLVAQTGTLKADGGTIQLRARAVDGLVSNLISAGGTTSASTVEDAVGAIVLDGVGGSIAIDGVLQTLGAAVGTVGGRIGILTDQDVVAASTAVVNASGIAGGGTIAVGTTVKRATAGPSLTRAPTSANVDVESGAKLASNATRAGDGGHVTILASDETMMAGSVAAKGGPRSGNGGGVEISGATLEMTGTTNVTAPRGEVGTVLLDPRDM